jgi:chemotaxis protein CheD
MADLKTASSRDDVLITHALGSCLGITVFDPVVGVGGMLHAMLPDSTIDPRKAGDNPAMFIDTGVPLLFRECYARGAQKPRMILRVAGGATSRAHPQDDYFRIGERNFVALRKLLWKNNVLIDASDVGGTDSRTMIFSLASGEVQIRKNGALGVLGRSAEVSRCH